MAKKKISYPPYQPKDLRLYSFVNFYLSSIQQGIQTAHIISDMVTDYRHARGQSKDMFLEWCAYGKTIIVLNGGMAKDITEIYEALWDNTVLPYPIGSFNEEPGAIHQEIQAVTAAGVILPPPIYDAKHRIEIFPSRKGFSTVKQDEWKEGDILWEEGTYEHKICSLLEGKSLAR